MIPKSRVDFNSKTAKIGSYSGVDQTKNRNIRKDSNKIDVFQDYFTDSSLSVIEDISLSLSNANCRLNASRRNADGDAGDFHRKSTRNTRNSGKFTATATEEAVKVVGPSGKTAGARKKNAASKRSSREKRRNSREDRSRGHAADDVSSEPGGADGCIGGDSLKSSEAIPAASSTTQSRVDKSRRNRKGSKSRKSQAAAPVLQMSLSEDEENDSTPDLSNTYIENEFSEYLEDTRRSGVMKKINFNQYNKQDVPWNDQQIANTLGPLELINDISQINEPSDSGKHVERSSFNASSGDKLIPSKTTSQKSHNLTFESDRNSFRDPEIDGGQCGSIEEFAEDTLKNKSAEASDRVSRSAEIRHNSFEIDDIASEHDSEIDRSGTPTNDKFVELNSSEISSANESQQIDPICRISNPGKIETSIRNEKRSDILSPTSLMSPIITKNRGRQIESDDYYSDENHESNSNHEKAVTRQSSFQKENSKSKNTKLNNQRENSKESELIKKKRNLRNSNQISLEKDKNNSIRQDISVVNNSKDGCSENKISVRSKNKKSNLEKSKKQSHKKYEMNQERDSSSENEISLRSRSKNKKSNLAKSKKQLLIMNNKRDISSENEITSRPNTEIKIHHISNSKNLSYEINNERDSSSEKEISFRSRSKNKKSHLSNSKNLSLQKDEMITQRHTSSEKEISFRSISKNKKSNLGKSKEISQQKDEMNHEREGSSENEISARSNLTNSKRHSHQSIVIQDNLEVENNQSECNNYLESSSGNEIATRQNSFETKKSHLKKSKKQSVQKDEVKQRERESEHEITDRQNSEDEPSHSRNEKSNGHRSDSRKQSLRVSKRLSNEMNRDCQNSRLIRIHDNDNLNYEISNHVIGNMSPINDNSRPPVDTFEENARLVPSSPRSPSRVDPSAVGSSPHEQVSTRVPRRSSTKKTSARRKSSNTDLRKRVLLANVATPTNNNDSTRKEVSFSPIISYSNRKTMHISNISQNEHHGEDEIPSYCTMDNENEATMMNRVRMNATASDGPVHYYELPTSMPDSPDYRPKPPKFIYPVQVKGLRRSKRTRLQTNRDPLARRVVHYGYDGTMIDVEENKIEEKKKKCDNRFASKFHGRGFPPKRKDLSMHDQALDVDFMDSDNNQVMVYDYENDDECMSNCISVTDTENIVPWVIDHEIYNIQKYFACVGYTMGKFTLFAKKTKELSNIEDNCLSFYVEYGLLSVNLNGTNFLRKSKTSFLVPPGNNYSIRNLRNDNAVLIFTQHKL